MNVVRVEHTIIDKTQTPPVPLVRHFYVSEDDLNGDQEHLNTYTKGGKLRKQRRHTVAISREHITATNT